MEREATSGADAPMATPHFAPLNAGYLRALNATPMRLAERHTIRQSCNSLLPVITSLNVSGMPSGLSISRHAPAVDTLRTRHVIPPARLNSIVPDLKTRCRGQLLRSFMTPARKAISQQATDTCN